MKKYRVILGFAFVFALTVTAVFMSNLAVAPAQAGSSSDDDENVVATVPADNVETEDIEEVPTVSGVSLQIGDIICVMGDGKLGGLIPGRYDHTQIYIGNGQVIDANPGAGVAYSTPRAGGHVYRVQASSSVKQAAVDWTITKVGLNYDYYLLSKQVIGSRYYCSELNWAAYKACGGPDIDQNPGWSWTYFNAVAPTEIADDGNTYYVGTV